MKPLPTRFIKYLCFFIFIPLLVMNRPLPGQSEADFPPGSQLPFKVMTSVFVKNIREIRNKAFSAEIEFRFTWNDRRASGNLFPRTENGKSLGPDRKTMQGPDVDKFMKANWHPYIMLANLSGSPAKSFKGLMVSDDGSVEFIWSLVGTFHSYEPNRNFPFDSRTLIVEITSSIYNSREVVFFLRQQEYEASGISQHIHLTDWNIGKLDFQIRDYRGWNGMDFKKLNAAIHISRNSVNYVPGIFVPYFAIMLFPLILLWLPPKELLNKAQITVSSFLALVALNLSFVMRYSEFELGDTCIVQLMGVGYFYIAVVLLTLMVVLNPIISKYVCSKYMANQWLSFLRWALPLSFIIVTGGIISMAMV
jgi:hypothetical protein